MKGGVNQVCDWRLHPGPIVLLLGERQRDTPFCISPATSLKEGRARALYETLVDANVWSGSHLKVAGNQEGSANQRVIKV